jgi:hypothetical protein
MGRRELYPSFFPEKTFKPLGGMVRRDYSMPITLVPFPLSLSLFIEGGRGGGGDPRQEGDAPFEFLTYQLDGKNEAYHGCNG